MARFPTNFLCACACAALAAATAMVAAPAPVSSAMADYRKMIAPMLEKYCYDCHGDGMEKGKVAFDDLGTDAEMLSSHDLWFKVLKNVRAGLMPKEDGPRPTSEEIGELERWIKYEAFGIDPAQPDPGRVTMRRLNRVEYHNTIHDLMGIDFASEVEFPPDDTGHGFDNLGEVLTVSPLLLEKYLQAAEEIVDQAVPRVAKVPAKLIALTRDFRREARVVEEPKPADGSAAEKNVPLEKGVEKKAGKAGNGGANGGGNGGAGDLNVRRGGRVAHTFTLAHAGTYKFSFEANVRSTFDFDAGRATLIVAIDDVEHDRREIVWGGKTVKIEHEQNWSAGPHKVTVELLPLPPLDAAKTEMEAPASAPATVAAAAAPIPPVAPPLDATLAQATAGKAAPPAAGRRGLGQGNRGAPPPTPRSVDLRVVSAQFTGPMEAELKEFWVPPENYTRFFTRETPPAATAQRDAYAAEILRTFATRAFRGPVEDAKIAQLVKIAHGVYAAPGARFEDGIARAMMGVLASPRFLFRLENPASGEAARRFADVDEYALASRLSYFLWSSMPDAELFRLAGRGELRQQLPAQVARMLKDAKSQAFVRNFPGQWLQARDIETVPINARAVLGFGNVRSNLANKADLDGAMRKAMRSETEMVFDYVLHEDRSVLEFIDADYTFVNAKLAAHYGLPAVDGDNLRRVELPPDSPRGGFLTEGTVLAVTSNPTRTSPVKRGLFVLENFLGTPPPPPPPDIPALEESTKTADGKELPLREALAIHRDKALCASCHARMDPLGFALENFNAMGMWRDTDAKQPIDPSGQLVTGEPFADIRELKHVLTHERRLDYYRCLTEKMLTYALGRGLEYYDVQTVDQIVDQLEKTQGRFSTLISGIIDSAPFQKMRNPALAAAVTSTTP